MSVSVPVEHGVEPLLVVVIALAVLVLVVLVAQNTDPARWTLRPRRRSRSTNSASGDAAGPGAETDAVADVPGGLHRQPRQE